MTATAVKSKREQRANIWSQMCELMDTAEREGRSLSAEEREKYQRAEAELDTLGSDIELEETHERKKAEMERVEREGNLGGVTRESEEVTPEQREQFGPAGTKVYERAFDKWLKRGMNVLDHEERSALQAGFAASDEIRAAGIGTGAAGGYTVPPAFRNRLIERLKLITSVRDVAMVIRTETGASLPWPTVDDTGNIGAILAENTQVSEQDVTFGQASLGAYMYTSKLIRVSYQLAQDTGFDLEGFLVRAMALRIGRIQNQHFTTGTGTGQPTGLVTGGVVGATLPTGNTTSIVAAGLDTFYDLIESIDPAYSGNWRWMFAQTVRAQLRKLKDGQGRYLWEPGLQVGAPDSLFGYPIKINNDMPAQAANSTSVAFGDFEEGYVIRDVADFFMLRLDERYADFLQTGYVGFQRTDATVQNTNAYKLLKQSAT